MDDLCVVFNKLFCFKMVMVSLFKKTELNLIEALMTALMALQTVDTKVRSIVDATTKSTNFFFQNKVICNTGQ